MFLWLREDKKYIQFLWTQLLLALAEHDYLKIPKPSQIVSSQDYLLEETGGYEKLFIVWLQHKNNNRYGFWEFLDI